MARPPAPFADPVSVSRDRGYLRIRYYPTGIITKPNDRRYLPGKWRADDPIERDEAQRTADKLRQDLLEHRAAYGITTGLPAHVKVTIGASIEAYLKMLEVKAEAPTGTIKTRRSQLTISLRPILLLDVEQLCSLANTVLANVRTAVTAKGKPVSGDTAKGRLAALRDYGEWVAKTYRTTDPFAHSVSTEDDRWARKRSKRADAKAKALRETPTDHADDDHPLLRGDFPGSAVPVALRQAIFCCETGRPPGAVDACAPTRRLGRPIDDDRAHQISEAPMFSANSGLRLCEMLAAHTSRIDLAELCITVDRQLDRYERWVGTTPPLVPPKHDRERVAVFFPSFAETLERLCWYADQHTGGWLFAPTRRQAWWADSFVDMCERGGEHLREQRDLAAAQGGQPSDLPPIWSHTFHGFRHLYASLALSPQSAGGLGWSVPFVQDSMGHASERTLRDFYQHITREEHRAAISVPFVWPNAS